MNNVWVGIFALIVCPALVSTGIYRIKEKFNPVKTIKNIILYLLIYFNFLSFVKCVLGEGEYSLLKSFEENSGRTYLHYLLPIVFLCIVLPLIHRKMEIISFPSKPYFLRYFYLLHIVQC